MGQILAHHLEVPDYRIGSDVEHFMATEFVDAVRSCLSSGGFATSKDGREAGGDFLVGFVGRLFMVQEDFAVTEPANSFAAVGSGWQLALGAMAVSTRRAPAKRIAAALGAAAQMHSYVREPFCIRAMSWGTVQGHLRAYEI
ncbi:hypothetical protein [Kaustia mangrovi]|uniref:hypothetical protein n=1 Tax=Kaustia mangrovi TaxID=2593653 RepID=UPI001BCA6934|nr:hypothetical protein [Kaustia mangrovi]